MPTITELTVLNSDDGFTRAEYEMEDYTYVYGYGFSNGLTVTKVGYVEADEFEEIEKWFRPFFHFTDVPIPVGATITAATFSVRHASSGSDSYSGKTLDVSAEDEDSPARPAESYSPPYDGIDSTLTTAKATWTLGAMVNGTWYASPDISAVIQELVDRGGWASGNDINMFLHNADSSAGTWNARWYAHDYGSGYEPKLEITYTEEAEAGETNTPRSFSLIAGGAMGTSFSLVGEGDTPPKVRI
jgi:hypothetical protein